MPEHSLDVQIFMGIDNTSDAVSRSVQRKGGIYFSEIDNVNIDDAGKPHRRDGYGNRVLTGTDVRSFWSNGRIALFGDGTSFKKLNTDETATTLMTGLNPTDPIAYVDVGNIVYFSNSSIIGYIDVRVGTTSAFPNPNQEYKQRMVGGQILEWYNSRLYAANGSDQYFSDATIPTRMDTRKNAIPHPSRITMMKAVTDGIYISDSENVYFQSGRSPFEFVQRKVLDVPAVEGMSVSVMVKKMRAVTKTAYWVTNDGKIYKGFSEGIVTVQQGGLFSMSNLDRGTAIIRNGTYQQLVTIGKLKAGIGDSSGEFITPIPVLTS